MTDTINNKIPFVPENTIDPAAGLNLSLNTIDALLQVLVQTVGANTPPAGVEGQRFIVGTAPTGLWAGQANKLARFLGGAWQFFDARYALNAADGLWYVRSASTWSALAGGAPAWGSITGAIADQSDLALALDGKQDESANLAALSGLTGAADRLPYFTGAGALSLATLTGLARNLLDDTTQAEMQSTLGLVKQTSAIDTTAGALMAVGAGGWMGDVPLLPAVTDIDDRSMRGWRYANLHTTAGVKPSTYGHVLNFGSAGDQVCQEFWNVTGVSDTHRRWYRQCFGGGAWGRWQELYQTGNILGIVSQSSGVPTGAIIERGSNANGRFTKYADGTVFMDNSGGAITTNPVTTVGTVTSVDANKLRYGYWF